MIMACAAKHTATRAGGLKEEKITYLLPLNAAPFPGPFPSWTSSLDGSSWVCPGHMLSGPACPMIPSLPFHLIRFGPVHLSIASWSGHYVCTSYRFVPVDYSFKYCDSPPLPPARYLAFSRLIPPSSRCKASEGTMGVLGALVKV